MVTVNDQHSEVAAGSTGLSDVFVGSSAMAARMQAFDWSGSPLGPPAFWPGTLKASLTLMLDSGFPMFIAWGDDLTFFYNDAYALILGDKHPLALGSPFRNIWAEIWDDISPLIERAMAGEAVRLENLPLRINRHGFDEDTTFSFSYSPARNDMGDVAGMFCACVETTQTVRTEAALRKSEARLRSLSELDEALRGSHNAPDAMLAAATLLARRLEASRTAYADVEADSDRFFIRADFTAPGIASSVGTYSLDLFGARAAADMRDGRTLVVRDVSGELDAGDGREMFLSIGIGAIICCPLVKNGRLVAMMAVHQHVPRDWHEDEIALVEAVVERCWAHVERVGAEARLRESEARFRNMADHAPTMLWVTDADARCLYLSRAWYEFTGQTEAEGEGFGWLEAVHPDDRGWSADTFMATNARHEAFRLEYRLRRHDGEYRWAIDAAAPRFEGEGEFLGYIGSVIDIDERREMEDALRDTSLHQRILIDELNHRVKNTLATIQSIAMQTFRDEDGTGAPPEQRKLFESRLIALAKAHDVLTRENWEGARLRDVILETIAAHTGGDQNAFSVEGPDSRLAPKMALSLSMALHELCTNAAKYGALSVPKGRVVICWTVEQNEAGNQLCLRWEERDGPAVTPPGRKGFGSRLIERQLARELRGSVELIYAPSGVVCIIKAPLSEAKADNASSSALPPNRTNR